MAPNRPNLIHPRFLAANQITGHPTASMHRSSKTRLGWRAPETFETGSPKQPDGVLKTGYGGSHSRPWLQGRARRLVGEHPAANHPGVTVNPKQASVPLGAQNAGAVPQVSCFCNSILLYSFVGSCVVFGVGLCNFGVA